MKRFFISFALFAALVFVVSCGGDSSKTGDNTDTGDTVTDEDTVDTDPTADTEPSDEPDSDNPDSAPDSSDSQPDDDADTDPDDVDTDPTNPDSGEKRKAGIYLGIIGFNNKLYSQPIKLLDTESKAEFISFIDTKLQPLNLTTLYYADDTALKMLDTYKPLPDKLTNVALVTFTDGLDNQSTADEFRPEFSTTEYLNYLHDKIVEEEGIHGLTLDAYTIGLNSGDIPDVLMEEFRDMLKLLASEGNAFEGSDMEEVKARFNEIAESLYKVSTSINMGVYIPGGYDDGQVIRYTFDNAETAESSNLYIQATYHKTSGVKTLENITYEGFQAGEETITSTKKGPNGELYFQFNDLKYSDGSTVPKEVFQNSSRLWKQTSSGSGWYGDIEIDMAELPPQVEEEQSSALIMLVLDCTTSLGENFEPMKEAAKEFVETLVNGGSGMSADTTLEECNDAGGSWNNSQNQCTRPAECSSKPLNSVWNDGGRNGTYSQSYSSSTGWSSPISSSYSEIAGECKYVCEEHYNWNSSSKTCNVETQQGNCSSKPENTVWNDNGANGKFTQTWNGSSWSPSSYTSEFSKTAGICKFVCTAGYIWQDGSCISAPTQTASCTGLPSNAQWNTVSSITQTYDGSEWYPSTTGVYNTVESTTECHFKCNSHYNWNSSGKTCAAETQQGNCSSKPANTVWNDNGANGKFTQTWSGSSWSPSSYTSTYSTSAGVCRYICASTYTWDGSSCTKPAFPECSSTSSTPCRDSSSGLIWSARASSTMTWSNAGTYCNNLTEGGYSDWHLPTIDELKTLLIANRVTSNCQVSETNGCLSSSCWSCSTCTQTGTQSSSGTGCSSWGSSYSDGRYSKLGDGAVYLWSSSTKSDGTDSAWLVDFLIGNVYDNAKSYSLYVRCVR
ncbi:DUF1566 domain-containing protein [bacterium]|nr:DUF1566 domain-containing protein [bacterium]